MHEMALAEEVRQIVEAAALRENALCVRRVVVEIGRLAAVEPSAFEFCFAAVMRGSVAESATLTLIETAGSGWCEDCAATVTVDELYSSCPCCGAYRLRITGGMQMRVREIEISNRR